jgi:5-methylthioadenosine/S-adenosylhomocysteine deaminase
VRILVHGDPVLAMSPGGAGIPDGAVIIDDDRIIAVGPRKALASSGPFDATLGSAAHMVLPGFINAHHHAGRTFRSGVPDIPFERRNVLLHRLVASGTEESLYRNTLYSCAELLSHGVTAAVVVFYPNTALPGMGAEAALRAYFDSGMRVAFGMAQRDRALYTHEDDERFLASMPSELAARVRASAIGRYSARSIGNDEYLDRIRALSAQWHGRQDRVRIDVCPDWFPSCTDELYQGSRRLATELGTHLQTHLLETRYEMLMARRWYGHSAAEHLERLGVLGPDVVCAHSVWLTRADMDAFARTGAIAVHNPASNLRLYSGISPVKEMQARGVTVAFGCDGLSFADDNDLLSDLRLADQLQRTPGIAGDRMTSRRLLEMATVVGARAMGMSGRIGELTPGALADLVLVRKDRMSAPYVHPGVPAEDLLLWRGRGDDVDTVVVGGRIVVEGGRVRTVDEARLAHELAADAHRAFDGAPTAEPPLDVEVEPYIIRLLSGWDWPEPEAGYRFNTH